MNVKTASLAGLIARLQAAGFALGTTETLDATHLLAKLAEHRADGVDATQLRDYLRPVLCKGGDAARRGNFDEIFQEWRDDDKPHVTESEITDTSNTQNTHQAAHNQRRPILLGMVLLILVLVYGWQSWQHHQENPIVTGNINQETPIRDHDTNPQKLPLANPTPPHPP